VLGLRHQFLRDRNSQHNQLQYTSL